MGATGELQHPIKLVVRRGEGREREKGDGGEGRERRGGRGGEGEEGRERRGGRGEGRGLRGQYSATHKIFSAGHEVRISTVRTSLKSVHFKQAA